MKNIFIFCVGTILLFSLSTVGAFEKVKGKRTLVVNRESGQKTVSLAPGEIVGVVSGCKEGEAVVGGGLTGWSPIPDSVNLFNSSLYFDGTMSGWFVEWRNNGDSTAFFEATVSALCIPGKMISGSELE